MLSFLEATACLTYVAASDGWSLKWLVTIVH